MTYLWDYEMQTDHQIPVRRAELEIINKKTKQNKNKKKDQEKNNPPNPPRKTTAANNNNNNNNNNNTKRQKQRRKRSYRIVDFAVPTNHKVEMWRKEYDI